MAITKNIVTDYGADNTGVADVAAKFISLKTDGQGQDVNLTIPAGTYNFVTSAGQWIDGMLDLTVAATGATLQGANSPNLQTNHLAQIGIDETTRTPPGFSAPGGESARIQTANIGATSVTLTAASASAGHISRFAVGRWMMVAGWDLQGIFQQGYSYPPNFQWSEFVKITSIVGNTVSFTGHPLRNFYDQNWPETNRGTNFECDAAGPATIFSLAAGWGGTSTFNGGTYNKSDLINCYRENFIMNGGTSAGLPIYPSINKLYRAINHTATSALTELDKCSDTIEITGGTYSSLKAQSPSARICTYSGVTVTNGLNGTPKNTIVDNCIIPAGGIRMGPQSYGVGETLTVTNSTVVGALTGGLEDNGPTNSSWHDVLRMSGGVITVPRCYGTSFSRVCFPSPTGRNVTFWSSSGGCIGSFKALSVISSDPWPAVDDQSATINLTTTNSSKTVTVSANLFTSGDIWKVIFLPGATSGGGNLYTFITGVSAWNGTTQDITVYQIATRTQSAVSQTIRWGTCNYYVQTDQAGGLPSSGLYGGTDLRIYAAPGRWVYFNNCTGSDEVLDLCQPGAQYKPWKSYTKRPYGGATQVGGTLSLLGNLVSIKVNVTKEYTGVAGFLNAQLSQFNNVSAIVGGSVGSLGYAVNLKIPGERVFTIGNSTGVKTGDTLYSGGVALGSPVFSSPIYMRGNSWDTRLSSDISGESSSLWPEFTVEIITDQGFPPDGTFPLFGNLRLHA